MIVVADTSPLNYLTLIGEVELLGSLFQTVLIPSAVAAELRHPKAPVPIQALMASLPAWLMVQSLSHSPRTELTGLDLGEREAIELALERNVSLILIDEARGRRRALSLHLEALGTLGVLELGAKHGKVNLRQALNSLALTNIRLSPALQAEALLRVADEHKRRDLNR